MKLLRPKEAAAKVGVTVKTLRAMTKRGEINAIVLPNGHRRYRSDDISRFMGENRDTLNGRSNDIDIDRMWGWIDRDLKNDFFETAGKIANKKEYQERMDEIPDLLRPLAYTIITLSCKNKEILGSGGPCILFRSELFSIAMELEKKGIDIHLPYAWFCDGVMIEPEWIVRITNGLVGWTCDPDYDNPDTCGLEDCRFRGSEPKEVE